MACSEYTKLIVLVRIRVSELSEVPFCELEKLKQKVGFKRCVCTVNVLPVNLFTKSISYCELSVKSVWESGGLVCIAESLPKEQKTSRSVQYFITWL